MSPGAGANRRRQAAAAASGADLTMRYRGARAHLMRLAMPPGLRQRPSCGPACWLSELIALNEDLRRLFLRETVHTRIASGEQIRDIVAAHYGVTRVELVGAQSARRVARPRQVAMYICARYAGLPSREIAALLGKRDESTVRFAVRAVAARQRRSRALAADIAALIAKCRLGSTA